VGACKKQEQNLSSGRSAIISQWKCNHDANDNNESTKTFVAGAATRACWQPTTSKCAFINILLKKMDRNLFPNSHLLKVSSFRPSRTGTLPFLLAWAGPDPSFRPSFYSPRLARSSGGTLRTRSSPPPATQRGCHLRKHASHLFFECFPYVCPEPVLAKGSRLV